MPATSTYTPTSNPLLNGILYGTKWAGSSFTFSFPSSAAVYGTPYGNGETSNNFEAFNATQQAATRAILQMYSSAANLNFTEVTETSSVHADLRYGESDSPNTAWAYYPTTNILGGDIWMNNSKNLYDNPQVGSYGFFTLIHETGHAMGLKHPQDVKGAFTQMALDHDSIEYTVMSYRSYVGASLSGYTVGSSSYPQTLMMYDIASLQYLYGADYSTNSGTTTYQWSSSTGQMSINGVAQGMPTGNKIFMTIWDGSGIDTYDFSNYSSGLTVNLQPGSWSTASSAQLASLGNGHYAAGNIANAMLYNNNIASLIENATGGSGIDKLTGNIGNNSLKGGAGNDVLDGATGTDTAVYTGLFSNYSIFKNSDGSWSVADLRSGSPDGTDKLWNIELVQFSDSLKVMGDLSLEPPAPPPPPPSPPPPPPPQSLEDPQSPPPPPTAAEITGSSSNDTMYGTAGNDRIDGLAGNDKLYGEAGADTIDGGTGKDYIYGGAGADVLTGGSDYDRFVFDAALNSGVDRITDFSHTYDTVVLDHHVFTEFTHDSYLKSSQFYAGTAAHDATDRIIYNSATGALMYDPDGNGAAAAVQFAQVTSGFNVTASDFYIV